MAETFKDLIQEIKTNLTLQQVAEQFNLGYSLEDGYHDCPLCGATGTKFSVRRGQSYYCYRCMAQEKPGDCFDYLIKIGKAKSFSEAASVIIKAFPEYNTRHAHIQLEKAVVGRQAILEKAYAFYRQELNDEVLDILNARGWYKSIESIPPGFCPHPDFLKSKGFSEEELTSCGLLSRYGSELFKEGIVFPIRNTQGHLVHLQCRATLEDTHYRWMSTKVAEAEDSKVGEINDYFFNSDRAMKACAETDLPLFITEGISDGYSALELDLHVVSTLGTHPNFEKNKDLFSKATTVYVLYDNDKYPIGDDNAGSLKSWQRVLPRLVKLQSIFPELIIYCCTPPDRPGLKDINDWLLSGLKLQDFISLLMDKALPLIDFIINHAAVTPQNCHALLELCCLQKDTLFAEKKLIAYAHKHELDIIAILQKAKAW